MRPHALITGAAKRVGRHLAIGLAKQGYNITLHYNKSNNEAVVLQKQIIELGLSCYTVQGDLLSTDSCHTLMEGLDGPPVTLLIHNASCFEKDDLSDVDGESLVKHMQINTFSAVLLSKGFMKQLPQGIDGHIICLTDGMKRWSISPDFLAYSLSKQSLEAFITLIAPAIAPRARINGVAPGATLPGVMDTEQTFQKIKHCAPLKRVSSPDEVLNAIISLERLPSVTGQIIDLSAGMSFSNRDAAANLL